MVDFELARRNYVYTFSAASTVAISSDNKGIKATLLGKA